MTRAALHLGRVFLELKEGRDDQAADAELGSLAMLKLKNGHSWDHLLDQRCAVVLGEAGTGKTTEFRQRCELLVASDRAAFFLTVEDLASDGLTGSLGSAARKRLATWSASAERGYFFLDAVDEARLNGKRFTTALRELERALGADIARATILISCRVSDWRAYSDREEILSALFPVAERETRTTAAEVMPPALGEVKQPENTEVVDQTRAGFNNPNSGRNESEKPKPEAPSPSRATVAVFALAPLNEAQVELLAGSLGVAKPKAFAEAARRASAHAYLARLSQSERR